MLEITSLSETSALMESEDYIDRMKAEYMQLEIRLVGLKAMLDKYKEGTLSFVPKCSYDLLNEQFKSMCVYRSLLQERFRVEEITID